MTTIPAYDLALIDSKAAEVQGAAAALDAAVAALDEAVGTHGDAIRADITNAIVSAVAGATTVPTITRRLSGVQGVPFVLPMIGNLTKDHGPALRISIKAMAKFGAVPANFFRPDAWKGGAARADQEVPLWNRIVQVSRGPKQGGIGAEDALALVDASNDWTEFETVVMQKLGLAKEKKSAGRKESKSPLEKAVAALESAIDAMSKVGEVTEDEKKGLIGDAEALLATAKEVAAK